MNILVVDDEKDIELIFRQNFRKEMKENSVNLFFSFSAEEALNFMKTDVGTDIILILSDINMPGMSGLQLLRRIKEKYIEKKIIMITAYDDEDNFNKSFKYGADDYITKPIDFNTLKSKISKIL